jgi:hypothetical protein
MTPEPVAHYRTKFVVILDDDPERIVQMRQQLSSIAAESLLNDLTFAGWRAVRVVPHSHLRSIGADWLPVVADLLADGSAEMLPTNR